MTIKYPAWRDVSEKIVQRFNQDGYGILFTVPELLTMLNIDMPTLGNSKDFEQVQLEFLAQLKPLQKELLETHYLCLENVHGLGYKVVHPRDQVNLVAQKYRKRAGKKLSQMMGILTFVDTKMLDPASRTSQISELGRLAFIKGAMRKRNIQLEHKP
ncbi:MAG: hypothetical protein JEZ11_03795 [Desulfobacterales bacterium]|nr:hypothetical protein [Desulfobacterales bacterium]